jgi:hypothetical protein
VNKLVFMSHDLACALNGLGGHACRYANTGGGTAPLARAAIAFTIQLAIETGQDPVALRSLEGTLLAALKEAP